MTEKSRCVCCCGTSSCHGNNKRTAYAYASKRADDNELCQRLVNPLQHGVRLHAVIDACHSGSALDLPFRCKVGRRT